MCIVAPKQFVPRLRGIDNTRCFEMKKMGDKAWRHSSGNLLIEKNDTGWTLYGKQRYNLEKQTAMIIKEYMPNETVKIHAILFIYFRKEKCGENILLYTASQTKFYKKFKNTSRFVCTDHKYGTTKPFYKWPSIPVIVYSENWGDFSMKDSLKITTDSVRVID